MIDREVKKIAHEQLRMGLQVSDLMNKVDDIYKNQEEFKVISTKLLFLMENDPSTGRKGVVAQAYDLSQRVDAIEDSRENEKAKQKVWVAVATVVGGLVMSLGTTIFKLIFGK